MTSIQSVLVKSSMRFARTIITLRKQHTDVYQMRKSFERVTSRKRMPHNVALSRFSIGNIDAAWVVPHNARQEVVMLFLHGGGYATGSINTHKALVAKIVLETGITGLLINYRLAPEHLFPAALEDAVAAYDYLMAQGYLPQNIILAGTSAGGGLALSTLLALKQANKTLPAAAVCLSPWTDLAVTGISIKEKARKDPFILPHLLSEWAAQYAGKEPVNNPLISPLYGDLSGLPPILIHVGTDEVILDDSVRFAQKAEEKGVAVTLEIWPGMMHSWHMHWHILPEGRKAINHIATYIHKQLPTV